MNENNPMNPNEELDSQQRDPIEEEKLEESAFYQAMENTPVESQQPIKIEQVEPEAQSVPVGKKLNFKTVFVSLLVVMLVSASTYTIGYYRGQIGISDEDLIKRIDLLMGDVKDQTVKESVYALMQENPENFEVSALSFSSVYEGIKPSVVGITSKSTYLDWFNVQRTKGGTGSGVIIDENNDVFYIVTNQHVIEGADEVVIEVADGVAVDAKLIGADAQTDLAVVSIAKKDIDAEVLKTLKPIPVGDSDALKVGEPAIAIGNPLGYNNTLTAGFISAKDRSMKSDQSGVYIQTDAAINPGNSGGALVNSSGELIGINTAKIADSTVEGMGFAIPINVAMPIVKELIDNGSVARPFIGIAGREISDQDASLYDIPMGVMIVDVFENSPAEKAGLRRTDLVIGIDDKKVFKMADITELIKTKKPGDTIELTIIREGKERMAVKVVLGNISNR